MNKVFLIDIDGTICDDIKNEESHLYPTANHFEPALQIINKWYVWPHSQEHGWCNRLEGTL